MPVNYLNQIKRLLAQLKSVLPAKKYAALQRAIKPLLAAHRKSGGDAALLKKVLALIHGYSTSADRAPRTKAGSARDLGRSTTMHSSKGGKLYAVRDKDGRFKDIAQYRRGRILVLGRRSAASAPPPKSDPRKTIANRSPVKRAPHVHRYEGGTTSAAPKTATKKHNALPRGNAPVKSKKKSAPARHTPALKPAAKKAAKKPSTPPRSRPALTRAKPKMARDGASPRVPVRGSSRRTTAKRATPPKQAPRWIQVQVFDLSAPKPSKPTPAFHAGKEHEIHVMIGASQRDWLVARGSDPSQSIDNELPEGTHKLTVMFFLPSHGTQRGTLTLPSSGPTPLAVFRFDVGSGGSAIQALISIVYRGRVLQTAILSGKAVADPAHAPKGARITLRLQVVVPGFAGLDQRESFDAALVTASHTDERAVAAGVVQGKAGAGKTLYFSQPRIDGAARKIREHLEGVVADDSSKVKLGSEAALRLLWNLAQEGRLLYELIGAKLERELPARDLSRLQLVQADPSAFIPIEFAYDLPAPANGATLCKNWKAALAGKQCTAAHHKEDALGHLKVVCPSGFWSIKKVIERQILKDQTSEEMNHSDFGLRAEPSAQRSSLAPIGGAVFAWSEIVDNAVSGTSAGVLKSLNRATGNKAAGVNTWLKWADTIAKRQPALLVLLSHTVNDALEIGPEDSNERATVAQINGRYVRKAPQDTPIVFLMGCDTAVADDNLYSFVGRFRDEGAAIVVGTITPVLGERSAAMVRTIVDKLARKRKQPQPFGELMRDARCALLAKGELTALCATSFGDASWLVR